MKPRRPPPLPTRRRAAIYTRVSTTSGLHQELTSLDVQREACRVRVTQEPTWDPLPQSYDDGGYTGANTDRPAFQRLIADIRAGHVHVVVAYKLDRICRSFTDFAKLVELCEEHNVVLVSVTQNFNTGDIMGRLLRNLLAIFAEFERELIVERTRDKIAAARRAGKWTGGLPPLGYDLVSGKLVVNEAEALVVREIFALYLEHRAVLTVVRILAQRGRLPKTRRKKERPGAPPEVPGTDDASAPAVLPWTKDMVLRVLRCRVYTGVLASGDEVFKGEHPAILDRETFEHVQRTLDDHAGRPAVSGRNPDYLLTGRLRCGACSKAMTPASTKKDNRTYRFYRCITRDKRGKEACSGRPLPAATIEGYVVDRLREMGRTHYADDVTHGLKVRLAAERDALAAEATRLSPAVERLQGESASLLETLGALVGPAKEQAQEKFTQTCRDLDRLRQRARDVERQRAHLRDTEATAAWVTEVLADFDGLWKAMTPENRRRLVAALVQTIVVDEDAGAMEITFADVLGGTELEGACA
ncbi:MAG: recombinase family protein [Polyangiaceae bacterium]